MNSCIKRFMNCAETNATLIMCHVSTICLRGVSLGSFWCSCFSPAASDLQHNVATRGRCGMILPVGLPLAVTNDQSGSSRTCLQHGLFIQEPLNIGRHVGVVLTVASQQGGDSDWIESAGRLGVFLCVTVLPVPQQLSLLSVMFQTADFGIKPDVFLMSVTVLLQSLHLMMVLLTFISTVSKDPSGPERRHSCWRLLKKSFSFQTWHTMLYASVQISNPWSIISAPDQ